MKRIAVLGSTGSIGTQTLEVVREQGDLSVTALAARGGRLDQLERQIREFSPKLVCCYEEAAAKRLKASVADCDVQIVSGMDGLIACAAEAPAELVVTAMVGMIGIRPTIAALENGRDIALANKETLVTAGHLIVPLARKAGRQLLPVDSEHSAIFQSLQGERRASIEKLLLTASGGPFRMKSAVELSRVTVADALRHPNWSMGKKITIDSATLVNKGLEMMEACWLFDVKPEQVEILVQPQSILHSAVQFTDGSVIGQLGLPDMKLPIQYALYYPERRANRLPRVNFYDLGQITFERPDVTRFPALALAYEAMEAGGTMPTVYNAANERAVQCFLDGQLGYLEIAALIAGAMRAHRVSAQPDVSGILKAEAETYDWINNALSVQE